MCDMSHWIQITVAALFVLCPWTSIADNVCNARKIAGQSVVCVCNATYCDDITRVVPQEGQFVSYTSSDAGSRFKKSEGSMESRFSRYSYSLVLDVNVSCSYQACQGFGGAVTDSAAINWKSLPEPAQRFLIDSYFSKTGLEYNMVRLPIGGCDFSTRRYAYNELPVGDSRLTNFSLAPEDYNYKMPMLRAAMEVSTSPVQVVATTWSPPDWMKSGYDFSPFCGALAPEYYQTYADYHLKFIESYEAEGLPIWAVTTTNEPANGLGTLVKFNCLGWTPETMGHWIEKNLGPTIRSSKYNDVKILCCDDQRPNIPFWFNLLVDLHPRALRYIDGVAVHFYDDAMTSPVYLSQTARSHPEKFILATEACEGFDGTGVLLGSWERARNYALDIMQDLNHFVVGWIDWNLCLDTEGGPNWVQNYVDSPIIVNATAEEFYKQPMFYVMGHFSKFIPRGSRRVAVTPSGSSAVSSVAFATTRNTLVVVLYNDGEAETVTVRVGGARGVSGGEVTVPLEARSITTVELRLPQARACREQNNRKGNVIEVSSKRPIVIEYKKGIISIL